MERLSILVPLMGDLTRFEDTLVSVLENRPERSEVVVVTNRPYDDPYDLRSEVVFAEAPAGAGLLDCLVSGLAASHAPVVHMIAAGTQATPGWADAALDRFDDANVGAVAPLVLDCQRPQAILSAGLRYTVAGGIAHLAAGRRLDRFRADDRRLCGPALDASFYRRAALERISGLRDYGSRQATAVELALALRNAEYSCVQEPQCLTIGIRELFCSCAGWSEGVAAERLYRRWPALPQGTRSSLGHMAIVAGECLRAPFQPRLIGQLAGRCWGALGIGKSREISLVEPAEEDILSSRPLSSHYAAAKSRAA